jgi:hypothetical protein
MMMMIPDKGAEAQHAHQHLQGAGQEESTHNDSYICLAGRQHICRDDRGCDQRHWVSWPRHQYGTAAEYGSQDSCRDGTVKARLRAETRERAEREAERQRHDAR